MTEVLSYHPLKEFANMDEQQVKILACELSVIGFNNIYREFETTLIESFKKYKDKDNVVGFFDSVKLPDNINIQKYLSVVYEQKLYTFIEDELFRCRFVDKSELFEKLQVNSRVYGLTAEESTAPSSSKATKAGRCNPKGVSYLYLATDKYTAISEINPYNKAIINVACARIKPNIRNDIRIVDLVYEGRQFPSSKEVNAAINEGVLREMSIKFTLPCGGEPDTEYLPTQYIAHQIKKAGYHGIAYNSLKSNGGINIVLFDKNLVEFYGKNELVRCTGVEYTIQNITHPSNVDPRLLKPFQLLKPDEVEVIHDKIKQGIKREK